MKDFAARFLFWSQALIVSLTCFCRLNTGFNFQYVYLHFPVFCYLEAGLVAPRGIKFKILRQFELNRISAFAITYLERGLHNKRLGSVCLLRRRLHSHLTCSCIFLAITKVNFNRLQQFGSEHFNYCALAWRPLVVQHLHFGSDDLFRNREVAFIIIGAISGLKMWRWLLTSGIFLLQSQVKLLVFFPVADRVSD